MEMSGSQGDTRFNFGLRPPDMMWISQISIKFIHVHEEIIIALTENIKNDAKYIITYQRCLLHIISQCIR